jgi:hypothetical protein
MFPARGALQNRNRMKTGPRRTPAPWNQRIAAIKLQYDSHVGSTVFLSALSSVPTRPRGSNGMASAAVMNYKEATNGLS